MTDAERSVLRLRALRTFIRGYPNGEWEGMLHEEGCVGTQIRKRSRIPDEGQVCHCDGDYEVALVKRALR